jgi:hypothetical protein
MRYRTPTQLHASLYARQRVATGKTSDISKDDRDAETGNSITIKGTGRKKRRNSYIK